jgi:DNA invertase Pin-like site-specific DNA recombinase
MTVIGYARVSTTDQDLSIQEAALKAAGCQVIRAEKRGGTTTEGREALRTVLEFLHAGDVLIVTRIDRLARSIGDLQDIVRTVRARGASLKATEQPIDTSTAAGKCFLDMLGVFAEFDVVALVGEGVTAGMPQHVGMGLELQVGAGRCTLDHSGEPGRGERGAALADEHEG